MFTRKANIPDRTVEHHEPQNFGDRFAYCLVKCMRMFADAFFRKRYVQRAVVLEMVAAVPARSVACYSTSNRFGISGTMKAELLDEAENERMHLMTFVNIAQPSVFERILNLVAQGSSSTCTSCSTSSR